MTTVLVVDDHQLVRAGLVALLATAADLEVVGQAGDGQEALLEEVADRSGRQGLGDPLALGEDSEPQDLISAVRSAARGHAPLDPRVARALQPTAASSPAPGDLLSGRESEVLVLVARGLVDKQIGRTLGISEHTVKVHLNNIFRRLGVNDRTSAALWARDHLPRAQP